MRKSPYLTTGIAPRNVTRNASLLYCMYIYIHVYVCIYTNIYVYDTTASTCTLTTPRTTLVLEGVKRFGINVSSEDAVWFSHFFRCAGADLRNTVPQCHLPCNRHPSRKHLCLLLRPTGVLLSSSPLCRQNSFPSIHSKRYPSISMYC